MKKYLLATIFAAFVGITPALAITKTATWTWNMDVANHKD